MEHSRGYADLVAMSISDFDQMLNQLEQGGHITTTEHRSLFEQLIAKYSDNG